jgi:acetyl-CoA carboxylase biotin carboxyl carrier protein
MNAKELKDLIDFLIEKDVSEFELEQGDTKMRMKRGAQVIAAPAYLPAAVAAPVQPVPVTASGAPVMHAATAAAPIPAAAAEPVEEAGLHVVRSPIVGTFYEAPSPGAPPFVKIGDEVRTGQPLCIIEAMKLMNEIESDASGSIVKRYVQNAQPVEYGQPLFAIRAS